MLSTLIPIKAVGQLNEMPRPANTSGLVSGARFKLGLILLKCLLRAQLLVPATWIEGLQAVQRRLAKVNRRVSSAFVSARLIALFSGA